MSFSLATHHNVQVRYVTAKDGRRSVHYTIRTETTREALAQAVALAKRIRGSSQHEAEITLLA